MRCLRLGGNSVWSVTGSPLSLEHYDNDNNIPVVWITARMDPECYAI